MKVNCWISDLLIEEERAKALSESKERSRTIVIKNPSPKLLEILNQMKENKELKIKELREDYEQNKSGL